MHTAVTAVRRRPPRIGRQEAQQLIGGGPVSPDRRALAEVLHTIAGPAQPDEMRGQDAVMEAFRQTRPELRTGPARRRASMCTAVVVKLAAAVAALLVAGSAWAAHARTLPPPMQQIVHDWLSGAGVPAPRPSDPIEGGTNDGDPVGTPTHERGAASSAGAQPTPSAPPSTSGAEPGRDTPPIVQLCRAYRTHQDNPDGPPMDPAMLDRLTATAEGEANIGPYCGRILTDHDRDRDAPRASGTPEKAPPDSTPADSTPTGGTVVLGDDEAPRGDESTPGGGRESWRAVTETLQGRRL
ncbi:hypothetical protein ACGFI9_19115 [Micromonospora sp. NPDC048930]|uniref:hypothetical protein n=1 Tax=Micromonospora sp. NPDC048930 TaxID=3364261 RepID=UPI0037234580